MGTIVIVGYAHAGTTMLAGILEILGVPMVDTNYKNMKWEDQDIVEALKNEEKFKQLVEERNAKYKVWGFKSPGAWLHSALLEAYLRDPIYLAMFKDPVSVTRRRFKQVTMNKVHNTTKQMEFCAKGMLESGLPIHMLSYSEAVLAPVKFTMKLANITELKVEEYQLKQIQEYIKPNLSDNARKEYPPIDVWIKRNYV